MRTGGGQEGQGAKQARDQGARAVRGSGKGGGPGKGGGLQKGQSGARVGPEGGRAAGGGQATWVDLRHRGRRASAPPPSVGGAA